MKAPKLRLRDIASEKKDELDDLFNAMNPESDDDDFWIGLHSINLEHRYVTLR